MLAVLLALLGGMAGLAASGGGSSKASTTNPSTGSDDQSGTFNSTSSAAAAASDPSDDQTDTAKAVGGGPKKGTPEKAKGLIDKSSDVIAFETAEPFVITPVNQPNPTDGIIAEPSALALAGDTLTGTVTSGRVVRLELPDDENIASLKVIEAANFGNVTVNPDNTLAVVLTNTTQTDNLTFKIEATDTDGNITLHDADLSVDKGSQDAGWGTGDLYMLETDSNGDLIIEHGDNHRDVFMSGSDDALTLADIAALEGLDVSKITGSFLSKNTEYGSTPDMALAPDAGMTLWYKISDSDTPNSNWLQLERGYEYDNLGRMVGRGALGESELHPQVITAYGDGADPVIHSEPIIYQEFSENIVISGIDFADGLTALWAENVILDDLTFTGNEVNLQGIDNLTLRNSEVLDVHHDAPKGGGDWDPSVDRISGVFIKSSENILIEGMLFDLNGWAEGYDEGLSGDAAHPPSYYNHNLYIQYDNLDVTFRDSITMRAASFGAQFRPGAFIEDNLFLENNAGLNVLGGNYKDAGYVGNYSLLNSNIVTSGAHKEVDEKEGALTYGADIHGRDNSLIDNIVAHLADPNNPDELAEREFGSDGLKVSSVYYNNTIEYNWVGANKYDNKEAYEENIGGLDKTILDETTIQNFTAQLLDKDNATIEDLATYLRGQANGALDDVVDADLIIAYFKNGFGLTTELRDEETTLRFAPDDRGEGVRWDNRINWNTEDLPGTQDGDSVDLAGNWVQYGGTTRIDNLNFGNAGQLDVTHGLLRVENYTAVGDAGAALNIDGAGQFWMDGYADKDLLDIDADGGRFANTGLFTGTTNLTATDNAQVILATDGADFALNNNSSLSIVGDDVDIGFDGESGGTGVLLLGTDATLSFTAQDGLGQISEFRSGHFDASAPNIQSGVNLGESELHLDITELAGAGALEETLIEVDELIGTFEDVTLIGLGATQNATLSIDYNTDTVKLSLGNTGDGTGKVTTLTTGDETNAEANSDLWAALTNGHGIYADDPEEDVQEEQDDALFEA